MKQVKIWRVNGIHIIAKDINEAIDLFRQHKAQVERPDLQCYTLNEDIDIKEVKFMQKVWTE